VAGRSRERKKGEGLTGKRKGRDREKGPKRPKGGHEGVVRPDSWKEDYPKNYRLSQILVKRIE